MEEGTVSVLGSPTVYTYAGPHAGMIECIPAPAGGVEIALETEEFTSLCPVTGQPDYAKIHVWYRPDELCVETKSLKTYLFAFRNERTFMEAAVRKICDDLAAACRPVRMTVEGEYRPRGGISARVTARYYRPKEETK
jgi:7-cyano-7-deazaguanine reductase